MDLPVEVVLMVLGYLSKKCLKQTRLVCRLLAVLGGQLLMDTIWISPREKDMEVFDSITQHPDSSKSVKHLVYDFAQFTPLTRKEYWFNLYMQFDNKDYELVVESNAAARDLRDVLNETTLEEDFWKKDSYKRCKLHPLFVEGVKQWSRLVQEQNDLFNSSWLDRVCRGLEALGPIQSVRIYNTWGKNFNICAGT